jgi:biopolymer transport protein TolR
MLVLLIVFMVTAPLMTVGVPVDLPETKASSLSDSTEPLVLTLTAKGVVYIQETPIKIGQLISKLKAITKQNYTTTIYIRGDRAISYGHVMHLLGLVNGAGFTKVALLSNSAGDPR